MKVLIRKFTSKLPPSLRAKLVRRQIRLSLTPPDDIIFKLAETEEELVGALKLLHDSYVRENFMKPHPSSLRATCYHALPTTSTLIAKRGDQVVATISMIRNNCLGLPLEKIFDLSHIKRKSVHIAEISSLAVHPDYRGHQGIFFLLTKYMMEYSLKFYHVAFWVIAVNPKHTEIYKDIFLFDELEKSIKKYDFVEGAPAIGYFTELSQLKLRFFQLYSKSPITKDLFSFYFNPHLTLPCFKFPTRTLNTVMDPVLTPQVFKNIFIDRAHLISTLSNDELSLLRTTYSSAPRFLDLLPIPLETKQVFEQRGASRFNVRCEAYLRPFDKEIYYPGLVTSVTYNGFMAELPQANLINRGDHFHAKIKLGPFDIKDVTATVVWVSSSGEAGFSLKEPSEAWKSTISHLLEDLSKETSY